VTTETALDRNIGRRVGERFVVESPLGAGGMGSIYQGKDERLGEAVAIKFLKHALHGDSVLRERFRREALSLAKLRHPGIVTVLDFGEADGELYTVLELVRGSTLGALLDRHGAMHALRAAPIFEQILLALETCHESAIVHRDIKPSNVMVTTLNGLDHVTLIDFGLAQVGGLAIDKLTETGVVHGTPHYMAPEQCRGEEVGPETDIYSAGVLFYELLAGAEPFQGKDAATFMAQHLFVDPAPLDAIAPHVSAGVAAAIHGALAKKMHERPTARELRHALASAFKGTDPQTLGEAAAVERRRVSGLSRSERAITGRVPASEAEGLAKPVLGHVIVWMDNDERSASLRGCLGAAGLSSSLWTKPETPELSDDNLAVVLSFASSQAGLARMKALRALAPALPVIVVDVGRPEDTTAAIRAGASDMLLRQAPDADVASKVKRLLRRRARQTP
jgi:serine/threonine-protein kinase